MYDNNSRLHSVYVDLAFIPSSFDDISHFCPLITFSCEKLKKKKWRQLQDSNLRGQSPKDFKSFSLTARTSCLILGFYEVCGVLYPSFRLRKSSYTQDVQIWHMY